MVTVVMIKRTHDWQVRLSADRTRCGCYDMVTAVTLVFPFISRNILELPVTLHDLLLFRCPVHTARWYGTILNITYQVRKYPVLCELFAVKSPSNIPIDQKVVKSVRVQYHCWCMITTTAIECEQIKTFCQICNRRFSIRNISCCPKCSIWRQVCQVCKVLESCSTSVLCPFKDV